MLIFLLLGISVLGVAIAFPLQVVFRDEGVTWRGRLAVALCFIASPASTTGAFTPPARRCEPKAHRPEDMEGDHTRLFVPSCPRAFRLTPPR